MDSSDSPPSDTPANLLAASMAELLTHMFLQAVMRVFLHDFFNNISNILYFLIIYLEDECEYNINKWREDTSKLSEFPLLPDNKIPGFLQVLPANFQVYFSFESKSGVSFEQ